MKQKKRIFNKKRKKRLSLLIGENIMITARKKKTNYKNYF